MNYDFTLTINARVPEAVCMDGVVAVCMRAALLAGGKPHLFVFSFSNVAWKDDLDFVKSESPDNGGFVLSGEIPLNLNETDMAVFKELFENVPVELILLSEDGTGFVHPERLYIKMQSGEYQTEHTRFCPVTPHEAYEPSAPRRFADYLDGLDGQEQAMDEEIIL